MVRVGNSFGQHRGNSECAMLAVHLGLNCAGMHHTDSRAGPGSQHQRSGRVSRSLSPPPLSALTTSALGSPAAPALEGCCCLGLRREEEHRSSCVLMVLRWPCAAVAQWFMHASVVQPCAGPSRVCTLKQQARLVVPSQQLASAK